MIQNLLNDHRVLHAGDDAYRALASLASFDVDVEHALQPLSPRHGGVAFRRCLVVRATLGLLTALASPGRRDKCSMKGISE